MVCVNVVAHGVGISGRNIVVGLQVIDLEELIKYMLCVVGIG